MENSKHTCKLCFRRFANGRALGGHMRSHVQQQRRTVEVGVASASFVLQNSSFSSSTSESETDDQAGPEKTAATAAATAAAGAGGSYGLRENPRKSFKFVDPEFSAVDYSAASFVFSTNNSASVVVQDVESETESSVPPPPPTTSPPPPLLRRRSARRRRTMTVNPPEVEQVSSVSDGTLDQDVARWLMMLSRDVRSWSPKLPEELPEEFSSEDEEKAGKRSKGASSARSRFQCGTCRKVFRSYQALGGHRASHKRTNTCVPPTSFEEHDEIRRSEHDIPAPVIHECPFCLRVFTSGQALGGHKRSHLVFGSYPSPPPPPPPVPAPVAAVAPRSLIDLNLPAPMDEEIECSAVSHAS